MKKYPEGHVLYRNLQKTYVNATHGERIYIYDENGRQYLDASGGAFVNSLGHANMEIINRISSQLSQVAYVNGMHFSSQAMEDLSDRMTKLSHGHFTKTLLLSSGSEATEAAIKLARQVCVERGQTQKYKIISRKPGYHGNTLFALSISARKSYKALYGPLLSEAFFVDTPYEYRCPVKYATEGTKHYISQLETLIAKEGAQNIAAFILEPISGSSAGGSCPPDDYLMQVQDICRRNQILLIADEVLVGAGRTGQFFASDHYSFKPDIMVLGKSINSGYMPVSLVLCTEALVADIAKGSGNFSHAQTYMMNPAAAACALAVVDYMDKNRTIDHVRSVGIEFHNLLKREILPLEHVGHIAGRGLLAGVELVKDKTSKEPFDRSKKVIERFRESAFGEGLIVWTQSGQCEDERGDIILLAPPFVIENQELAMVVSRLKKVLKSFVF